MLRMEAEDVPPAHEIHEDVEMTALDNIEQETGLGKKDVSQIVESEIISPIKQALLVAGCFWLAMMLRLGLSFFGASAIIIIYCGTFQVDYFKVKKRRRFKILEIRLFQTFVLLFIIATIGIIGDVIKIIPGSRYFTSPYLSGVVGQMSQFVKTKSFWTDVNIKDFLKISQQLFFFSASCILVGRTVVNVVHMCSTSDYLLIVSHEMRAFLSTSIAMLTGIIAFNSTADANEDPKLWAQFLVSTLGIWIGMCALHNIMKNKDIPVLRTNNLHGCMKIHNVILCQSIFVGLIQTIMMLMHTSIFGAFHPTRGETTGHWASLKEVYDYYNGTRSDKDPAKNPVITIASFDLICMLTQINVIARTVQHNLEFKKVIEIMDNFIREEEESHPW